MSRPQLRLAVSLVSVPLVLFACADHALVPPNPMPEEQTDNWRSVDVTRKVDILFMIDNSRSMEQEQENLARNFPAFIDQLRNIKGGLPDVHIGVITSDLGAGTLDSSGCRPGGLGGLFQGWDRGCGLQENQRFIAASDGEKTRNYQAICRPCSPAWPGSAPAAAASSTSWRPPARR
jgi:hypothetical protein